MKLNSEFTCEQAQQIVDLLVFQQTGKHLSDLEIVILRGAWHNQTYEEIAEVEGYTSNYLSKDVGNKLWGSLSTALQEKVSKKNFRAALQREWYKQNSLRQVDSTWEVKPIDPTRQSFKEVPVTQILDRARRSTSSATENLSFPEGSVALDSPFYIERSPIESICYETIAKPGSLIRIKAAKWMGKTSLVNRILEKGSSSQKTVYLDFGSVERSICQDLDKLLRWLCVMVSRQLELDNKVNDYWDTDILGSNDNCAVYFEEYILEEITSAIALALDNIDKLFVYSDVIEDFFGMLRSWHEKGKIDPRWAKLKLILSHSTEVYIPLDINQSPFNAGVPILLEEFNCSQVNTLASLYQLEWGESEISKLMDLVGGHPHLVSLAMYYIKKQNLTLDRLLITATSETGIYSHLLRRLSNILNRSPALSSAFATVIESDSPTALNSLQIYQLHSIGLIKYKNNLVSPSCKLYRDYFKQVFS